MSSFTFQANLFQQGEDRNTDHPGAPTLVPLNGNSYDVDVYGEYSWTVSDDARNYIPKILLTEYKLEYASELNALQQLIGGAGDNITFGFAALGETAAGRLASSIFTGVTTDLAGGRLRTPSPDALRKQANETLAEKGITSFLGSDMLADVGNYNDNSLTPYRGLYSTKKTGWGYVLPYLGAGNMTDITNTFAQADFVGRFFEPFKKLADSATDTQAQKNLTSKSLFAGGLAASNALVGGVPGAIRAEVPQSFTGTSTENIKVVFYLLNTIKPEDIRKNYEFCYLLTYQNLPNRRSINVLDSPPLYRATVVGYKTLPICYMNDLKIENVGAVRLVDIGQTSDKNEATNSVLRGAESNSNTVKMIPEAYKISFTLQSVFMNSQNMFVFAASPDGLVTTSVASVTNPPPYSPPNFNFPGVDAGGPALATGGFPAVLPNSTA